MDCEFRVALAWWKSSLSILKVIRGIGFILFKTPNRCNVDLYIMVRHSRIKDFFLLGGFRFVLLIVWLTPGFLIPCIARAVCVLSRLFVTRDVRILRQNMENILKMQKGGRESVEFENKVLHNLYCCMLETLKCYYKPDLFQVDGTEELGVLIAEFEKAGKGAVMVTGHLGSWEYAGRCSVRLAKNEFYVLGKPFGSPAITRFLDKARKRLGMEVLWTDQPMVLKTMIKTLRGGGSLGIVMDQRPDAGSGIPVSFLGKDTLFVGGPGKVVAKTDCGVLASFCLRTGPMQYRLYTEKILPAGHGITDTAEITRLMAEEIERVIKLHPHQWTWNNNRWAVRVRKGKKKTA